MRNESDCRNLWRGLNQQDKQENSHIHVSPYHHTKQTNKQTKQKKKQKNSWHPISHYLKELLNQLDKYDLYPRCESNLHL